MEVVNVQNIPGRFNIAIIIARTHQDVTQKLLEGTTQRLQELDFHSAQLTEVWVPDVTDIPLTAQRLARTDKFEAIICLGCILYQNMLGFLSDQISKGCQEVALTNDIPVISGVLTVENIAQAHSQVGHSKMHAGRHAADAAFELISVLRQI